VWELDLERAVGTYWSLTTISATPAAIVQAWSAAAQEAWTDELYVTEHDGVTWASFLFNSGQARMTVCECALLVSERRFPAPHFLTAVTEASFGVNLGWMLHVRAGRAVCGDSWANPTFGEQARRAFERGV
jgi:hypothetical protein